MAIIILTFYSYPSLIGHKTTEIEHEERYLTTSSWKFQVQKEINAINPTTPPSTQREPLLPILKFICIIVKLNHMFIYTLSLTHTQAMLSLAIRSNTMFSYELFPGTPKNHNNNNNNNICWCCCWTTTTMMLMMMTWMNVYLAIVCLSSNGPEWGEKKEWWSIKPKTKNGSPTTSTSIWSCVFGKGTCPEMFFQKKKKCKNKTKKSCMTLEYVSFN